MLRESFNIYGIKILQFAFDGDHNKVIYSGTHDNSTTCEWWGRVNKRVCNIVKEYLGEHVDKDNISDVFNETILATECDVAILCMQDLLGWTIPHA